MASQLNAYLVYIPADEDEPGKVQIRNSQTYYEPPEPYGVIDVIVAGTRAKAKRLFLDEHRRVMYPEDWTALRTRILLHDVTLFDEVREGSLSFKHKSLYDAAWARVHEILDHEGRYCDCPTEDAATL